MNAQRVEVFHACHREAVVVGIADYLEFNFLPTLQRLFYQNLLGESERAFGQFNEGFLVRTNTASQSTQSISRAHHHGVANLAGCLQCVLHALHSVALRSLHRNLVQLLHKEVTVFGVHNRLNGSTQHTHAIFLKNSVLVEFRTAVQRRLSAECQQNAVGTFFLDDFFHEIRSYRQEINLIGDTFRCLDSSNVRVYQNRTDTFFAQRLQRLRTGIVKLSGLTNLERTRTQDKHFL